LLSKSMTLCMFWSISKTLRFSFSFRSKRFLSSRRCCSSLAIGWPRKFSQNEISRNCTTFLFSNFAKFCKLSQNEGSEVFQKQKKSSLN
jgi:hypothetical protein